MNRHDIWLIIIVLAVGGIIYLLTHFVESEASKADVYYDNKLVLTIDLTINEEKKYTVDGYNGKVVIEAKKGQIRVEKENSPRHLCSKQGWVSSSYEPIICLPNRITIKIEDTNDEIDAVVR